MRNYLLLLALSILLLACQNKPKEKATPPASSVSNTGEAPIDSIPAPPVVPLDYDSTQWLELTGLDSTIQLDIRYATTNNFVGEVLYDCGRCFLRPEVARQVLAAHQELRAKGLGLKIYDCYRPRPIQYKMWEIYPEPGYVADPSKGSIHNRGGAVDLTIINSQGEELDMGTDFDYFGQEANHTYLNLPAEVLANRKLLRELMAKYGLKKIRTEWWHYNYAAQSYALAEWVWPCKN